MINTSNVKDHRPNTVADLSAAQAEAWWLADIDARGRLMTRGDWTLGQSLGHLASWINAGWTAAPLKPPLFLSCLDR